MGRVDVACLHAVAKSCSATPQRDRDNEVYARNHISHKFGRWVHGILEKVHNDRIETFSESGKTSKRLL